MFINKSFWSRKRMLQKDSISEPTSSTNTTPQDYVLHGLFSNFDYYFFFLMKKLHEAWRFFVLQQIFTFDSGA